MNNKNFGKYLITLLIFILLSGKAYNLQAQSILVKAELDTNIIEIGDQIWLKLSIEQGKKDKINFPSIKDTIINGIEVLNILPLDTQNIKNSKIILSKKYLITAFDFGNFDIPPFIFTLFSDTLYSNSLNLRVNPVNLDSTEKAQIDTTQAFPIFDIKAPINTPFTFTEFIQRFYVYIIIFFALAALVTLIIIYLKRRPKNQPLFRIPEKPKEPAHIIAFRELDALRDKKLWQKGLEKEYYLELSDIIRAYIENRYQIQTFERTSHELMEIIKNQRIIENGLFTELNDLLTLADLAKFAKYKPLPNENDLCLKSAYHFVEQTLLQEKTASENELKEESENSTDLQNKL